jgi:hypothetical protein
MVDAERALTVAAGIDGQAGNDTWSRDAKLSWSIDQPSLATMIFPMAMSGA